EMLHEPSREIPVVKRLPSLPVMCKAEIRFQADNLLRHRGGFAQSFEPGVSRAQQPQIGGEPWLVSRRQLCPPHRFFVVARRVVRASKIGMIEEQGCIE